MPHRRLGSILALSLGVLLAAGVGEGCPVELSPEQWREDLHFLVAHIRETHPQPFFRTTEAAFGAEAAALEAAIPELDDDQIVLRLMELVASIGDGHTVLVPGGPRPVRHAYPLRLHPFHDGVYVMYIGAHLAEFAGGRVVGIGDLTMDEALARAGAVTSGDSDVGRRWPAALLFTLPHVMHALGVASSPLEMNLTVVTRDGLTREATVAAVEPEEPFHSWYVRMSGGLFEPPPGVECAGPFADGGGNLPPHLAGLVPRTRVMWFEHLKEQRALYVQLNVIDDTPEESFAAFNDRLWKYYEPPRSRHRQADLRSALQPRRQRLPAPAPHPRADPARGHHQRGRLFALVGNATFSAAVNLLGQMIRHTGVTVVGEPTGGPLNWCSDIDFALLPRSGLPLIVSTLCWQGGHPSDTRGTHPPDFPVLTSGGDFMAGRAPVLQTVLDGRVRLAGVDLVDAEEATGASPRE